MLYSYLCFYDTKQILGRRTRTAQETVTDTVTHTRGCIDTTDSPYEEHEVARNMYRIEINT